VALVVLTLAEMKAHSALAEVQALTAETLEPLEAEALDLLEAELGRRLTVDAADVARTVDGREISLLVLPERLDSFTSVVSTSLGDVTSSVETTTNGWVLRGAHPSTYHWRGHITITGKWGLSCPDRVKRVLVDVVEAMAVRKSDLVSHRDELAPWGSIADGGMRADRDSSHREATLENLLRYDVKKRLSGFYRPTGVVEAV
jgi:hypothetical protein